MEKGRKGGRKRGRDQSTADMRQEKLAAYVETTSVIDLDKLTKLVPNVEEINIENDDLSPEEESYLATQIAGWNKLDQKEISDSIVERISALRRARDRPVVIPSQPLSLRVWRVFEESRDAILSIQERRAIDSSNLALTLRMALTLTSDTGYSSLEAFESDVGNRFVGTDEAPFEQVYHKQADGSLDYSQVAISCVVRDDDHAQLKLVFILKQTLGLDALTETRGGWHIQSHVITLPSVVLK